MKKIFLILGVLIAISVVILSAGCVQEKVVYVTVTPTPTPTPVATPTATPVPVVTYSGYPDIYADEISHNWDDYYTERVTYYVSNKGTAVAKDVGIEVDAIASAYRSMPIDATATVSVGVLQPGEGRYVDAIFRYANARDSDDYHEFSVTTSHLA